MSRIDWLTAEAEQTLTKGNYLIGTKAISVSEKLEERYRVIAESVENYLNLPVANSLFEVLCKGWLGLASPVLANFSNTQRTGSLPISCFVVCPDDSLESIFNTLTEAALLSKAGGGVGVDLLKIREQGATFGDDKTGVSSGSLSWAKIFDTAVSHVSQSGVRRGSFAYYVDIDSKDFLSFINSKDHTVGDHRQHLDGNIAVVIKDSFMMRLKADEPEARERFELVLRSRMQTGSPYIYWIDQAEEVMPESLQRAGRRYGGSNICSEISSYADSEHTMVCCLSSLNLDKYLEWEDWKDANGYSVPQLSIFLLDAVMEEFLIKGAKMPGLEKAIRLATKARPLGLGCMGYHSLLQKLWMPWASEEAKEFNQKLFSKLQLEMELASEKLGKLLRCPEWAGNKRNAQLSAIAPTASNSIICNANSSGIEPLAANAYTRNSAKGVFIKKNDNLIELLDELNQNTDLVWQSIIRNSGSVQHLDFLSSTQKEVFLTAFEIDQRDIVEQAGERQKYIDQMQSINLFFDSNASAEYVYSTHIRAYTSGVHSLYYVRSSSATSRAVKQKIATIYTKDGCPWCEKAKVLLKKQNYGIIELKQKHPDWPTYPAIIIDNKLIGGYDELVGETTAECSACEG